MRSRSGFTLLETLLSLSIMGICLALIMPFLDSQRSVWEDQAEIREEFETLTSALQWIARDLQGAGYGWAGHPVRELAAASISYVVPGEDPGRTAPGKNDMRLIRVYARESDLMYRIRGWDSLRGEWKSGSSHKLASNLRNISFSGFSAGGAPAASPEEVRALEIALEGGRTGKLRTFVALRNGPAGQ